MKPIDGLDIEVNTYNEIMHLTRVLEFCRTGQITDTENIKKVYNFFKDNPDGMINTGAEGVRFFDDHGNLLEVLALGAAFAGTAVLPNRIFSYKPPYRPSSGGYYGGD